MLYRYRLLSTDTHNTRVVERHHLRKDRWLHVNGELPELEKYSFIEVQTAFVLLDFNRIDRDALKNLERLESNTKVELLAVARSIGIAEHKLKGKKKSELAQLIKETINI